jgi:hypothetical protein
VFLAGDQSRNLRRTAFNAPAVGCENRDVGMFAWPDVHGVVDAFRVTLGEILKAAKLI